MHTPLAVGEGVALGRFDCAAEDDAWHRDNQQLGAHLLAFPGTPVRITYPGTPSVVTDRHQVMFYSDTQLYRRSLLCPSGDHCTFVVVDDGVIREMVREFDQAAADAVPFTFRHTHAQVDARTYVTQRALAHCDSPDPRHATRALYSVVRDCVAAAYRDRKPEAHTVAGARVRRELVEDAKAVIAGWCGRPPSLAWVAAQVHTSPYHLTRVFGEVTGLPLYRYLHQARLRAAVDMVLGSGTSLADISQQLGFADQAHFTTAFRRLFGIAPGALRRRRRTA